MTDILLYASGGRKVTEVAVGVTVPVGRQFVSTTHAGQAVRRLLGVPGW